MNLLESVVGSESFRRLSASFGGTDYRVPATLECDSGAELVSTVGEEAARELVRYAGGDTVYIASGHALSLRQRYADIIRLHQSGMNPAEIARRYTFIDRYSERQVWAILAGERRQARNLLNQADLFV